MRDLFQAGIGGGPRFGVGESPGRKEDAALVQGRGRYTDDINLPGQAYAAMVRSNDAHGAIKVIDTAAALAMPGVLGVYTAADLLAAGFREMPQGVSTPNRDGSPMRWPSWQALPKDRVLYVGQAVAFVVAETPEAARDAAESVNVEIEPLAAAVTVADAVATEALQIHPELPANIALDYQTGDAAEVAAAFAAAAHVTRLAIVNSRIIVNPMEPRSSLASYDEATGRYTLTAGTQGVFVTRNQTAATMGIAPEMLRVLTGNVGGSFGMKGHPFPEDLCLLYAAHALGRPVKWTDTRSGSFVSDTHGRAHEMTAELALDADGHFLAFRLTGHGNVGAYLTQGGIIPPTLNATRNTVSVYRTPLIEIATKCVFTNTTPVGAYRGNGRPEANYYVERMVDTAAAELGIDPAEIRRRNHIRPEDLPYAAPSGFTYDSGNFPAVLDRALELSDWQGFDARRRDSLARGKLRGRGIGQFLEVTGIPVNEMGGIRFEADGSVTLLTGTMDIGQGHHSSFAQVAVSALGIPFERLRLDQSDSDQLIAGAATGGSRSLMASGTALIEASDMVIAKGRKAAAYLFDADESAVDFANGVFSVRASNHRIGILELADALRRRGDLPKDVPASLDVNHVTRSGTPAFPNGCHVAEVEIDPDTGLTEVVRYTSVGDFGNLVNPVLVEGQLHGGVVQGIGQALFERTVFDESGQLLSGSFMDYALPRAGDVPNIGFASLPSPARTNPLGVKGCGEAGCAGALGSVMNAVMNALRPLGVRQIDMPATPARIWQAIQDAKQAGQ